MSRESSFSDNQFYGMTSDASFEMGLVFVIMSFDEKIMMCTLLLKMSVERLD